MNLVAIDARSMAVFSIFIGGIMASTMAYILRARKTFRGFGMWTASSILYCVGQSFFALQGAVPAWLSVVLANALLVLAFQWVLRGIWRFGEAEPGIQMDACVVAYMIASQIAFTYAFPSLAARVVNFCVVNIIQTLVSLMAVFSMARKIKIKVNASLVAGFVSILLISLVRMAMMLGFGPEEGARYVLDSSIQAISLMLYSGAYVFIFLGLQIQNAQRVEDELKRAAEEVKTLSGIIPICAHCKKVRNDSGYWEQVEAYVSRYTDADFSHGICPECMEKHFPEQAAKMREVNSDR